MRNAHAKRAESEGSQKTSQLQNEIVEGRIYLGLAGRRKDKFMIRLGI
jgi:hypothetical protein